MGSEMCIRDSWNSSLGLWNSTLGLWNSSLALWNSSLALWNSSLALWSSSCGPLELKPRHLELKPCPLELKPVYTRPEHCSSRSHTATYEIELFLDGVHRVCLHKVFIWGFQINCSFLGVSISLFRHLRSTGFFKEQLLHCHSKVVEHSHVPIRSLMDSVVKGNNHRNI